MEVRKTRSSKQNLRSTHQTQCANNIRVRVRIQMFMIKSQKQSPGDILLK